MFTGIITDVGRVRRLHRGAGDAGVDLAIATAYDSAAIALGASIACSGVCLTVVSVELGVFSVQASGETLSCSTLGDWVEGRRINLERALRAGDELGGHIVSGHVDGVARLRERRPEGDSVRLVLEAPTALMPFIAPKGSVALDGISLTVNEVATDHFGVNIIPYTLAHTSLGDAVTGQRMNLEIDPLARYLARLLEARPGHWDPGNAKLGNSGQAAR
ncbi:MAG TPA: riboflavin synthase [Stellaceae bacterium]|jgi:riboflavin synthase|nr:riboflavin synthase [Stellaceae bacterium]